MEQIRDMTTTTTTNYTIKIIHPELGILNEEVYVDAIQFKLLLKMVQGCIELRNDLTFFNGQDFFIHVPHKHLSQSIITTKTESYTLSELLIQKSKMEALETK